MNDDDDLMIEYKKAIAAFVIADAELETARNEHKITSLKRDLAYGARDQAEARLVRARHAWEIAQ